jgi:hypothetical protein
MTAEPGPEAAPKDRLKALLPLVPTSLREFEPGMRITGFARVYQGGDGPLKPVPLTAVVLDDQGARIYGRTETLEPNRFGARRAADFSIELPTPVMRPGAYLLRLDVQDRNAAIRREVRFLLR